MPATLLTTRIQHVLEERWISRQHHQVNVELATFGHQNHVGQIMPLIQRFDVCQQSPGVIWRLQRSYSTSGCRHCGCLATTGPPLVRLMTSHFTCSKLCLWKKGIHLSQYSNGEFSHCTARGATYRALWWMSRLHDITGVVFATGYRDCCTEHGAKPKVKSAIFKGKAFKKFAMSWCPWFRDRPSILHSLTAHWLILTIAPISGWKGGGGGVSLLKDKLYFINYRSANSGFRREKQQYI